jgi:small neutral amino acid transporter SnatA (MarC family)
VEWRPADEGHAVDHESITFTFAVDLFLLLLIGVGPKIALVPLQEITADRVSDHLDESRMLVTEKVFAFLLAALAVQLGLNGRRRIACFG